jgi:HEAT repeat protein
MKMTILLIMAMSPALVQAQPTKREVLAQEVDDYVKVVNGAAATFLNKRLPPAERVKALAPHSTIYDEKQVEQFKGVVLDADEQPEVRAMAMDRIARYVPGDERLRQVGTEWLGNPQAPRVLREEALTLEANFSFSSMNTPEIYQKLLDDPEMAIRVFAFTKLVIHGDARAQQKLINGLENPGAATVPAPTAIGILSMALKKEYYPAVYQVLLQTKDDATRLEAIRALGFYPPARQALIAISRDGNEKETNREAALGALYAGDREHIVQYVTPILTGTGASPRLQGVAIQMTIDVRQASTYRTKAKRADDHDRLIQKLARESVDPEVRKIANTYLESVRPRY